MLNKLRCCKRLIGRRASFLATLTLAGVVLSGCGAPPPQGYVIEKDGNYVLVAMPCNPDTFTAVYVDHTSDISRLWQTKAEPKTAAHEIVLFAENKGFQETIPTRDIPTTEVEIIFDMPGYSRSGQITGTLQRIPKGKALTSSGIVSMAQVLHWQYGI